jgi:hypothetical protein
MLKGFNYPLTPKGISTLNPPPPWHYSSDFLYIEFWSDPASVAALLPALSEGSRFAGSLSAGGQRLAEGIVTLTESLKDFSLLGGRPVVNLLHQPRLAAGMQDKPAIHQLVENVPHDVKIEQAWVGDGTLTLPVVRGEELSDLAPVRCGKGIRASMAYIVDDLKTLKQITAA